MPDWLRFVRARLAGSAKNIAVSEDAMEELASHLDDFYTALRASGMTHRGAARRTYQQVGSWLELRQGILAARREDSMNNRIRQFWIPGLVTLTLANIILALFHELRIEPRLIGLGDYGALCLYVGWLLALPLVGALGSYLSRRAGGNMPSVCLVAAFPAVVLGGLFFVILPLALIFDRNVSAHFQIAGFFVGLAGWVVLPGIALLVGVPLEGLWRSGLQTKPAETQ